MTQQEFFDKYAPDAIAAMKATGIPASVTLAQAAIESEWSIAAYQNNFFGIKAGKSWTGEKQLLRTTELLRFATIESYKLATGQEFPDVISIEPSTSYPGFSLWHVRDYFRAYASSSDGFTDHALFFKQNGRYSQALLDEKDAIKFAQDISHAGYSTTPNYGDVIAKMITEYNLTKYDSQ